MQWFRNLKIRVKLLFGFVLVALVGAAIGLAGFRGLSTMRVALDEVANKRMVAIDALNQMLEGLLNVPMGVRGLLNPMISGELRAGLYDRVDEGFALADEARKAYDALPKGEEQMKLFQDAMVVWDDWKNAVDHVLTLCRDIDRLLAEGRTTDDSEVIAQFEYLNAYFMDEVAAKTTNTMQALKSIIDRNKNMAAEAKQNAEKAYASSLLLLVSFIGSGVLASILLGLFLANLISKPINHLARVADRIALGDTDVEVTATTKDEIGELMASFGAMVASTKEQIAAVESVATGDLDVEVRQRSEKDLLAISLANLISSTKEQVGVAERIAAGDLTVKVKPRSDKDTLAIAMKKLVESLNLIIAQIQEATDQVATATNQISAGAQSVAQGAAEQASSLEEISSSLEEIASMAKTNAENARQAQSLAQVASGSALEGRQAMDNLNQAISEIKSATDETGRIIKTIDDIAFQTNLLALNAAVEAARAGEAGRGFAVVAEEVRNLALRSAEAAKETARMIEESVRRADNGVKIAEGVHKSLLEITEGTKKVNDLVAEIAAASQEQTQGIDQVTIATTQMNKVTQESAASAEEGASGAEELSSQVDQLRQTIAWFKVDEHRQALRPRSGLDTAQKSSKVSTELLEDMSGTGGPHIPALAIAAGSSMKSHSIPLDDDEEFKGF